MRNLRYCLLFVLLFFQDFKNLPTNRNKNRRIHCTLIEKYNLNICYLFTLSELLWKQDFFLIVLSFFTLQYCFLKILTHSWFFVNSHRATVQEGEVSTFKIRLAAPRPKYTVLPVKLQVAIPVFVNLKMIFISIW